jgi:hypothetical protein
LELKTVLKLHLKPRERSYTEVILIMAVPAVLYAVFLTVDNYATPIFTVFGQVTSEQESWTPKNQYRCYFIIDSESVGHIEAFDHRRCHHALVPGQKVKLAVRVGRLTGHVGAMYGSIRNID